MKGTKLNPTSGLSDAQGNRGRDSEIDYVNDFRYSSLDKFMAYLAERDALRLASKGAASDGDCFVS